VKIPITCPTCNSHFEASPDQAGKRGKCPKCGGVIEVPINSWEKVKISAVRNESEVSDEPQLPPEKPGNQEPQKVVIDFPNVQKVKIVDINIPISSMAKLIVYFSIAGVFVCIAASMLWMLWLLFIGTLWNK